MVCDLMGQNPSSSLPMTDQNHSSQNISPFRSSMPPISVPLRFASSTKRRGSDQCAGSRRANIRTREVGVEIALDQSSLVFQEAYDDGNSATLASTTLDMSLLLTDKHHNHSANELQFDRQPASFGSDDSAMRTLKAAQQQSSDGFSTASSDDVARVSSFSSTEFSSPKFDKCENLISTKGKHTQSKTLIHFKWDQTKFYSAKQVFLVLKPAVDAQTRCSSPQSPVSSSFYKCGSDLDEIRIRMSPVYNQKKMLPQANLSTKQRPQSAAINPRPQCFTTELELICGTEYQFYYEVDGEIRYDIDSDTTTVATERGENLIVNTMKVEDLLTCLDDELLSDDDIENNNQGNCNNTKPWWPLSKPHHHETTATTMTTPAETTPIRGFIIKPCIKKFSACLYSTSSYCRSSKKVVHFTDDVVVAAEQQRRPEAPVMMPMQDRALPRVSASSSQ